MTNLLVVNAGSSSIKLAVFSSDLTPKLTAEAAGIGGRGTLRVARTSAELVIPDHAAAFDLLLEQLSAQGMAPEQFSAAGHRVVHGGAELTRPERVTPQVLDQIDQCSALAPLHNPHNVAAMRSLVAQLPGLPQVACFDTAFHATNPPEATTYAVPQAWQQQGIRRYGFHGISYEALVQTMLDRGLLPPRLLACHLGNGASLCAIRDGRSVATTMGYSPLEGLTMGTRAGNIDAAAVLDRAEQHGIAETRANLLHRSGLLGLSDVSHDMRVLQETDTNATRFAIRHFTYWIIRHAGSMIAAMGGIDALAFTGGIGENAASLRADIHKHLAWTGLPENAVHVITAAEERQIARHTQDLLKQTLPS